MTYKALIDIGDYKKGEEVPAEKAEVWMKMYKFSPVEKVSDESSEPEVKEISVPEKEVQNYSVPEVKSTESLVEEKVQEEDENKDSVLEDYLARGVNVVKKNVSKDNLSKEQLEKLLELEKAGKNRSKIIESIEERLTEE